MFFWRAIIDGGSRMPGGSATPLTPLGLWLFVGCWLCCLCGDGGGGSRGGALAAPVVAAAAAASEPSPRTHTSETYDPTLRRLRQQPSLNDINGRMGLEPEKSHLKSALRKLGLWLLGQAEDLQEAAATQRSLGGAYRPKSSGVGQEQREVTQVESADQDIASAWQETRADEALVVPRLWKKNIVKLSNQKWPKPRDGAKY